MIFEDSGNKYDLEIRQQAGAHKQSNRAVDKAFEAFGKCMSRNTERRRLFVTAV
ncbi:hypothetical protein [Burkholderia sp. NLJ2]|uniref:hypothetical protein n=1 Tax=Burkholderia sp. NLJ2 TaxID=3090699 RepID=UPI003C6CA982